MAIIKKTLPAVVILINFCILGAGIYSKEQRSETMVKINDIAINIEYIKVRHVKTDRTDELLFDESTSLDLVELLNDTCFKLSEDMPKIEPEEYYMITFNSRQYLVVMPEIIDGKIFSTYTKTDMCIRDRCKVQGLSGKGRTLFGKVDFQKAIILSLIHIWSQPDRADCPSSSNVPGKWQTRWPLQPKAPAGYRKAITAIPVSYTHLDVYKSQS